MLGFFEEPLVLPSESGITLKFLLSICITCSMNNRISSGLTLELEVEGELQRERV